MKSADLLKHSKISKNQNQYKMFMQVKQSKCSVEACLFLYI